MKGLLFAVLLILTACLSCRKDPSIAIGQAVNPCGDTAILFCLSPNPAMDSIRVFFTNPQHGKTAIICYDYSGHELVKLLDSSLVKGNHLFDFDISYLPNGIVFCRIDVGENIYSLKLIKQ